jgi:hypothetical protein
MTFKRDTLAYFMCTWVRMSACGGQKRESGPLELEMVAVYSMWVPGRLQEQQVLLTTEVSFLLLLNNFHKISYLKMQSTELNSVRKSVLCNSLSGSMNTPPWFEHRV